MGLWLGLGLRFGLGLGVGLGLDHVLYVSGGEALPTDAQLHAERELRGGDREVRVRRRQNVRCREMREGFERVAADALRIEDAPGAAGGAVEGGEWR